MTDAPNRPPKLRSLGIGKSCSSAATAWAGTTVCALGLFNPAASLARILVCAMPALHV